MGSSRLPRQLLNFGMVRTKIYRFSFHVDAACYKIRLIIPLNQAVVLFTFVVWDYKILIFFVAQTYRLRFQ